MDRSVLEEYAGLRIERQNVKHRLDQLRRQAAAIKDEVVADTVLGSREDLTIGPIKVVGKPTMAYAEKLRQISALEQRYLVLDIELIAKMGEVEDFLRDIRSSKIRTILRMRYLDGMPWEKISWRFNKSKSWAQLTVDRFFEKNLN